MWYSYVTELHAYDVVIKDLVIKMGHYLCQTLYMCIYIYILYLYIYLKCLAWKYLFPFWCTRRFSVKHKVIEIGFCRLSSHQFFRCGFHEMPYMCLQYKPHRSKHCTPECLCSTFEAPFCLQVNYSPVPMSETCFKISVFTIGN